MSNQPKDFMDWMYNTQHWTIEDAARQIGISEEQVQRAVIGRQISKTSERKIRDAGYTGWLVVRK